jgi:hypothetical protein
LHEKKVPMQAFESELLKGYLLGNKEKQQSFKCELIFVDAMNKVSAA